MTTPHDPAHERWEELAAGHALDALEPDEEALFVVHLETCAHCRRGLDEHAFVAAQLGGLAEDTEARPPAWRDIRAGIVTGGAPPDVSLDDRRARRAMPARGTLRSSRVLGAAAALIVLAGAAIAGWQLSHGSESAAEQAIKRCAVAPACTVVRLPSNGHEKAAVLVADGTARVVPTSLPTPPSDRVYVLWQMPRDGRPVLVSELRSLEPGHEGPPIALTLPYADTAAFALSIERADVVPSRPTDVVAVGAARSNA